MMGAVVTMVAQGLILVAGALGALVWTSRKWPWAARCLARVARIEQRKTPPGV